MYTDVVYVEVELYSNDIAGNMRYSDSFNSGQTYYQGNRTVLKNSWAPPREKIYLSHNFGNVFLNDVNYCAQLSLLGALSLHFYHLYHLYHGTQ